MPFPEAWHLEFNDVDPVIQILAKIVLFELHGQIFVGCAEYAHVHGDLFLGPHRANGLFLDATQEFNLHREGQVGDFVQKQRATIGSLKEAFLIR